MVDGYDVVRHHLAGQRTITAELRPLHVARVWVARR